MKKCRRLMYDLVVLILLSFLLSCDRTGTIQIIPDGSNSVRKYALNPNS